jgi:hypothetical protein
MAGQGGPPPPDEAEDAAAELNYEYILDFPIGIPIFLFAHVLPAVLAQTSSIPLKIIRMVHETY